MTTPLCSRHNFKLFGFSGGAGAVDGSANPPGPGHATLAALEAKLRDFIAAYFAQLPYNVLVNILSSFGRSKEMKQAARLAGNYHELLGYHLDLGTLHIRGCVPRCPCN